MTHLIRAAHRSISLKVATFFIGGSQRIFSWEKAPFLSQELQHLYPRWCFSIVDLEFSIKDLLQLLATHNIWGATWSIYVASSTTFLDSFCSAHDDSHHPSSCSTRSIEVTMCPSCWCALASQIGPHAQWCKKTNATPWAGRQSTISGAYGASCKQAGARREGQQAVNT